MQDEIFEVIDDVSGKVTGTALRSQCHGNPALVHRAVHVVVRHKDGRILLQKRSMDKDIQPGKWDSAVGGHLKPGEDFLMAAKRELCEELGVEDPVDFQFLFDYKIRNEIESENVRVFICEYSGPFTIQKSELDAVEFFSGKTLLQKLQDNETENLTPILCRELKMLASSGIITEKQN